MDKTQNQCFFSWNLAVLQFQQINHKLSNYYRRRDTQKLSFKKIIEHQYKILQQKTGQIEGIEIYDYLYISILSLQKELQRAQHSIRDINEEKVDRYCVKKEERWRDREKRERERAINIYVYRERERVIDIERNKKKEKGGQRERANVETKIIYLSLTFNAFVSNSF